MDSLDRWSVGEWMTREPITVSYECPVREAFYIMRSRRIRHLLVVEGDELIGIVTDRDLRRPDLPDEPYDWNDYYNPDENYEVGNVMNRQVFVARSSDPLEKAITLFIDNKIGALPVLDEGNRVVGILTQHDVLRAFDGVLAESGGILRFRASQNH